jgi:hypothetical protein
LRRPVRLHALRGSARSDGVHRVLPAHIGEPCTDGHSQAIHVGPAPRRVINNDGVARPRETRRMPAPRYESGAQRDTVVFGGASVSN